MLTKNVRISGKATSCLQGDKFSHVARNVQNWDLDTFLVFQKAQLRSGIVLFTTEFTESTEVWFRTGDAKGASAIVARRISYSSASGLIEGRIGWCGEG